MSSIKKRMEAQEKKRTITMLKNLIKKIENGEFKVVGIGSWGGGVAGRWLFRIIVDESEDSTSNPKF